MRQSSSYLNTSTQYIHIQSKIGSIKYSSCTILEQENTTLAPMSMRFTLRCSGQ